MSADTKASGPLVSRYAGALLDMAQAQNALDRVESDINDLFSMLASSHDLRALIRGRGVGRERLSETVLALARRAEFHPLTVGFLATLASNGRLRILGAVLRAVRRESARRRGFVDAKVETAWPLSSSQIRTLKDTIGQRLGAKEVTLDVSVNRDLIGGVVLTVGSRRIDASVASRLERLGRAMRAGARGQSSARI